MLECLGMLEYWKLAMLAMLAMLENGKFSLWQAIEKVSMAIAHIA